MFTAIVGLRRHFAKCCFVLTTYVPCANQRYTISLRTHLVDMGGKFEKYLISADNCIGCTEHTSIIHATFEFVYLETLVPARTV
jgi:hypothetical protein